MSRVEGEWKACLLGTSGSEVTEEVISAGQIRRLCKIWSQKVKIEGKVHKSLEMGVSWAVVQTPPATRY